MKKAVAVKYISDLPAPFVLARGRKHLADKIIAYAREHDITIVEDDNLADRLIELDPDEFIPEDLYDIIAEILAFIYLTEKSVETL